MDDESLEAVLDAPANHARFVVSIPLLCYSHSVGMRDDGGSAQTVPVSVLVHIAVRTLPKS